MTFCSDCRNFQSHVTRAQGEIVGLARSLSSRDSSRNTSTLARITGAKIELEEVRGLYKTHTATEHKEAA